MNIDQEIAIFCRNIRNIRKQAGLPQKEMAQLMEISVYSLRKIEAGVLPPMLGIHAVWNLCDSFHIQPHMIFEEKE